MNKRAMLMVVSGMTCLQVAGYAAPADSMSYKYDASGNLIEKTTGDKSAKFEFNGQRLSSVTLSDGTQKELAYDQGGRITDAASGLTYGYDHGLLPTTVSRTDGGKEEIYYNAEGKIVGMKAEGEMSAVIWDGERMISKKDVSTVFEVGDNWGGTPVLTFGKDREGSPHICDCIGTSVYQDGASVEASPFGEGKPGFITGKPYIEEIGGYAFANRMYLPELAIWNSPDPSGYRDGHSRYGYLRNPFSQYDRLGLEPNWTGYTIYEDMQPKTGPGAESKVYWHDATWPFENYNVYKQDLTYAKGNAFPSSGQIVTSSGPYTIGLTFYNEVTWGDEFTVGSQYAQVSSGSGGATGSGVYYEVGWSATPVHYQDLVCAYPEKVDTWKWQKRYNGMASGPGGAETGATSAWYSMTADIYDGSILKKAGRKEL